ncbi:MAG TPA: transporter [Chitinophagales bacterium]|nr:transporter [Chitinophagales bacterium]
MAKYILMIGVLIAGSDTKLFGQDITPIQTDRPDQTETPFTVPKNHFQVENGFSVEQTDNITKSFTEPSTLFKYGLNDHFEVGLITEFTTIKSNLTIFGLSPVTVRFKEKITDEKGVLPTTSFIGYLTIPHFATDNLKVTYFAPAFRFTMQHTLSEKISIGYNLGAERDGESAEPAFIYTLTTGYSISDKVGAYAEIYGFVPQSSKADHRFDCGLNYLLRTNILLDISGGTGLTHNAPDYYLALGFSFRLKD